MRLRGFGCSTIGPAHKQENQPNQDAVMIHSIRHGWCASVCDGLGSKTLSHIGSKSATQQVRKILRQRQAGTDTTPLQSCLDIQDSWLKEFGKNFGSFATTCLWAHVRPNGNGEAAQVGDGLLLVKANGVFQVITPPRDGFANQTQTLAQANAADWTTTEFKLSQPGDGVLAMTDGISDDLLPDQLEGFFDVIYSRLKKNKKRRCKRWMIKELEEWSTPKHGDDKSIAGIFRAD